MKIKVLFISMLLLFSFFACACEAYASENDTQSFNNLDDAEISMIRAELGLDHAEASRIYVLLRSSGLSSKIKHISEWNDPDTDEIYYRIRTDGEKYDIYFYSDNSVKIVVGDKSYSYSANEGVFPVESSSGDGIDTSFSATESDDVSDNAIDTMRGTESESIQDEDDPDPVLTEGLETEPLETEPPETEPPETEPPETEPPETEPPEFDTIMPEEKVEIIVNINTKKFHYPDCRSVKTMSEKNKAVVYVRDTSELVADGYDPCKICKP